MLERNAIEDFNKRRGGPKEVYFTKLVKNIIDLAYHSQFETKMQMAQRATSKNSHLDLRKRNFSKESHQDLINFLYPYTCVTVKNIWTDFEEIYNLATDSNEDPSEVPFPKSQA